MNDHGKRVTYEGALLYDVLARRGIDFGKGLRGKQLSSYVAASARDGYEVVFALSEFDPTIVDYGIIDPPVQARSWRAAPWIFVRMSQFPAPLRLREWKTNLKGV